jgi:coenzyme F420 hydrogenase subunit beta
MIGNYDSCYIGHSSNEEIRHNSASGGLVTQLLVFALEKGIVDGVITTRMNARRTREEIISASKSKYCPVPVNAAIRDIPRQKGRFAVVGLPCHIQGIRKAEIVNAKLKERIILHMGLFCSHTVSFSGTEMLLEKLGIKKKDVKQLNYRGNGWPGQLSITLSNEHQLTMGFFDYWRPLFAPYFFTPLRCLCCYDLANESADLSFGDAWLRSIMRRDKEGSSIVVSRSRIGEELLSRAKSEGVITLKRIDVGQIVRSQYSPLRLKKLGLRARMALLNSCNVRTPDHGKIMSSPNPFLYIVGLLQLFDAFVSQKKSIQNAITRTPFLCLRAWGTALYYLERLSYRL